MEFQFESLGPAIRWVVLIFMIVFAILLLAFVVVLAALPGQIAKARKHPQSQAVNICGWVGLPTGILWAIAMVWAYWVEKQPGTASEAWSVDLTRQLDHLENSIAALEAKQ
ncbi:DUF3302 domain-containing protein [Rubripirellula reticaptiva]|uniref:Inner membrane protein YiaW n=1 Tax=Rubripirellula reticaptiva TaxID=2528013 RepID=A0A5C6F6W0_9BACT|nr:DUF3302 domain-containing protein [Rubripirellula reticaptiva]TWU56320.1 Inner membrane protein YiaW [Rubripirellula reticaptiva]